MLCVRLCVVRLCVVRLCVVRVLVHGNLPQWRRDGVSVSPAELEGKYLEVDKSVSGVYDCEVRGAGGSVVSSSICVGADGRIAIKQLAGTGTAGGSGSGRWRLTSQGVSCM